MRKKARPELSEGPTKEHRNQASFSKEVLTPMGAPCVTRYRRRMPLTPIAVRRAIIEEVAGKPDAVRERSLRRRLTVLDRALTDSQAEMLDRLILCISELGNIPTVDLKRLPGSSNRYAREPFSEWRRGEISAMRFVTGRLSKEELLLVYALASPAASTPEGGAAAREAEVKRLAALAVKVDSLYTLHRDVARSSRAASQRPAHHALS